MKKFQSGILFFGILLLGIFYARYGHSFIQLIYEGRAGSFLNSVIEGQKVYPLKVYLETGDGMFFAFIFLFLAAVFLFPLLRSSSPLGIKGQWFLSAALLFFIVASIYFRPALQENESVYLIGPKRLFNPGFLANDWMWSKRQYGHFVFDLLASPFALFLNPLKLALWGRIFVWCLLIGSFVKWAKTLGLTAWEFVLGFTFWIYAGQSLAPGESVFHGVEANSFSYFFLLVALNGALNDKWIKAAVCSGLAVSFHVLVGGWGALALWVCLLFRIRELGVKKIVLFSGLALLFSLAGFVPLVIEVLNGGRMSAEDFSVLVLFRNPHHLDPRSFLTGSAGMAILAQYLLTLLFLWRSFERQHARMLTIFLTTLMVFFGLGVGARQSNLFAFLSLYPFRVGPVFLLLLFSFGAFHFLNCQLQKKSSFSKAAGLLVILLLGFHMAEAQIPENFLKQTAAFFIEWKHFLWNHEKSDFEEAAEWVKAHTERESVFIAPPWEYQFWALAQRAQVVCFKLTPVNRAIEEWMSRLVDLNGGTAFQHSGAEALTELKQHYVNLTDEQLEKIKTKYQAPYYMTTKKRQDSPFPLAYSNRSYFLYDLRGERFS